MWRPFRRTSKAAHSSVSLGTYVINEYIIPIVGVQLRNGGVQIEAQLRCHRRRIRIPNGSDFRIHGLDGQLLVSGHASLPNDIDIKASDDGIVLIINQPLRFIGKRAFDV